jgi:hypothetical protein
VLQNDNNKNTKIKDKIYLSLILSSIFLILFANIGTEHILVKYIFNKRENETNDGNLANIVLTAKLVNDVYRWVGSHNLTNPTLNLSSNVDTQITVNCLADDPEEHELIIEELASDGNSEEIIASNEIEGESIQIQLCLIY